MISLIIGIMVSLVVTIVGTPLLIKLVHKLNYGQYIRQDGPKSHLVKRGTPTLGGVVINLAVVLGWCSSALYRFLARGEVPSWSAVLVLFAMLSMGFLGFIDDFAKVRKKQSEGLTVKGKFIGQFHPRHHIRGAGADSADQIRLPQRPGRHELHRKAVLQL